MTISSSSAYDADVIVVGAGPIGLTTACALGHYGSADACVRGAHRAQAELTRQQCVGPRAGVAPRNWRARCSHRSFLRDREANCFPEWKTARPGAAGRGEEPVCQGTL